MGVKRARAAHKAIMKAIKISSRGKLFLALGLVVGLVALAVAMVPATKPSYTRYLGPPLKDGSRVTFLYPTSVSQFLVRPSDKMPQPYIIQDVQLVKPPSAAEAVLSHFPLWSRLSPTNDAGVGVLTTTIAPFKVTQDCRIVHNHVRPPLMRYSGNYCNDEIIVQKASSGLQFHFEYQYFASSKSASFLKHESIITQSFQVLPPGVAPPVP
jgi:hypothetical protein